MSQYAMCEISGSDSLSGAKERKICLECGLVIGVERQSFGMIRHIEHQDDEIDGHETRIEALESYIRETFTDDCQEDYPEGCDCPTCKALKLLPDLRS